VLLQIENMLDMMTLTSGLTTNSRRVSSGQASSCHTEPKCWGPLRLYLFTYASLFAQLLTATAIAALADLLSRPELRHDQPGSCETHKRLIFYRQDIIDFCAHR
jgi:hypothetical protein